MATTIAAKGLVKTFGEGDIQVRAIRGIDMEVEGGEVVLIMGPSGSGKTTLLSMLGAMMRPTSGSVVIQGVDLATLPEKKLPRFRAKSFGFVFQDFNLLSSLTAQENVEYALNLAGTTGRQARARASRLLHGLGLSERVRFRPEKLSGGEKQRVALARALANEPGVILADEPTANLDSKIGHEIARLLRRAADEQDRSVIIVSHDARLKDIADRVLWLEDGEFKSVHEMADDPVCGMLVERDGAPHFVHEGSSYFFCSKECRDDFSTAPLTYLTSALHSSEGHWRPR